MKRTWLLLCAALAAGCADGPPQPVPGDTPPGDACERPAECGCWSCLCEGIGGDPGAAQLCKPDGHCPSGQEACTTVCALADTTVTQAISMDTCPAIP